MNTITEVHPPTSNSKNNILKKCLFNRHPEIKKTVNFLTKTVNFLTETVKFWPKRSNDLTETENFLTETVNFVYRIGKIFDQNG